MPSPIIEGQNEVLSAHVKGIIHRTEIFVVERARTTRRLLSAICHPVPIDRLTIFELNKNNPAEGLGHFLSAHIHKGDIGVFSEAGCPGIADPGSLVVAWAHRHGIIVDPLVGPSSIFLALMGSGFNGQNFTFHGYLPNKAGALKNKLQKLERILDHSGYTQIFMDTPYRNTFLLDQCTKALKNQTLLCVACDINAPSQFILSQSIEEWKKFDGKLLHKRPAIFLLGK